MAVNRKKKPDGSSDPEFFHIAAWEKLGESCHKFLSKGRKVAVVGPVTSKVYKPENGEPRAQMEVIANDIEFLSPMNSGDDQSRQQAPQNQPTPVSNEELPF